MGRYSALRSLEEPPGSTFPRQTSRSFLGVARGFSYYSCTISPPCHPYLDASSDFASRNPRYPFFSLTPEQLVLCSQVVDTALFKSYLVVRPGLLGPLCRRDNWCEVAEVEETLAAREVCTFSFSPCTQDKLIVFSISVILSSLICIMSEKCIPKLWSSFASE